MIFILLEKSVYHFLLIKNSNFGRISRRILHMVSFPLNFPSLIIEPLI